MGSIQAAKFIINGDASLITASRDNNYSSSLDIFGDAYSYYSFAWYDKNFVDKNILGIENSKNNSGVIPASYGFNAKGEDKYEIINDFGPEKIWSYMYQKEK